MERVENDIPTRLFKHPALDGTVNRIFGLPVEFREVPYRALDIHVFHNGVRCRFNLLHRASVLLELEDIKLKDFNEFVFRIHRLLVTRRPYKLRQGARQT